MKNPLFLISICLIRKSAAFGVQRNARSPTHLFAAEPTSPGNVQRPQNEFSRTYRTESVLGSRQSDYHISVEATEEEKVALATRFDLSKIYNLTATLEMRREPIIKGGANRVTGVEVTGIVAAAVTQTCVRTNEDFDVDVEFPLFAVVRPVASFSDDSQDADDFSELESFFQEEAKSRKGKKRDTKTATPDRNVNEVDMAALQRMLQDFDLEDDVIEDESIYAFDGVIDIGELVSQLFWLKLDPYPKKPGTYPIRTSITG